MTEAAPLKPLDAIAVRITEYLSAGGLFNPEMAKHEAVRDLLMDCRDAIEADRRAPQAELAAMSADELRTRLQACLEVQRETAAHNRRLRGELDGEIAPQAEPAASERDMREARARGWCSFCGCGNDRLGYAHLPTCKRPAPEQPPLPFDCALIVRCAKWCGKEKCRDHDAIAHAELVKAARLALKVATEMHELADNWPGIAYSYDLDERTKAALAALRAALPPEGT